METETLSAQQVASAVEARAELVGSPDVSIIHSRVRVRRRRRRVGAAAIAASAVVAGLMLVGAVGGTRDVETAGPVDESESAVDGSPETSADVSAPEDAEPVESTTSIVAPSTTHPPVVSSAPSTISPQTSTTASTTTSTSTTTTSSTTEPVSTTVPETTIAPSTTVVESSTAESRIARDLWRGFDGQDYDVSIGLNHNPDPYGPNGYAYETHVEYELSIRDGELIRVLPADEFASQFEVFVLSEAFFDWMDERSIASRDSGYSDGFSWEFDHSNIPYPGDFPWVDARGEAKHLNFDFRHHSYYPDPCETLGLEPGPPPESAPPTVVATRTAILDALATCDFAMLEHLSSSDDAAFNIRAEARVFWHIEYSRGGEMTSLWNILQGTPTVIDDGDAFRWEGDGDALPATKITVDGQWVWLYME